MDRARSNDMESANPNRDRTSGIANCIRQEAQGVLTTGQRAVIHLGLTGIDANGFNLRKDRYAPRVSARKSRTREIAAHETTY